MRKLSSMRTTDLDHTTSTRHDIRLSNLDLESMGVKVEDEVYLHLPGRNTPDVVVKLKFNQVRNLVQGDPRILRKMQEDEHREDHYPLP